MQTFENAAWYTIAAKASGKVITAEGIENGALICIEQNEDKDSQLWSISAEGDCYKIVNKASGKALDVISLGTENGTYLHQWDFAGGNSQLWKIEERQDGAVVIRSALSGKCIDIVGMAAETDGTNLQIWENTDGENQQWLTSAKPEEKTAEPEQTAAAKPEEKTAEPEQTAAAKPEEKTAEPEQTAPVHEEKKTTTRKKSSTAGSSRKTSSARKRKTTKTAKAGEEVKPKRTYKTKAQKEAEAKAAASVKNTENK